MVLDPRVTFTRESLATYFDAAGMLRYTNSNQIWSSQDFTDPNWGKRNGATVTANATTAPDGTTTATRLNHNTVGTVTGGYVSQNIGEIPYRAIWSAYAKAGSKNFLVLALGTADHEWASFDLSSGTVGTVRDSFISAGIQSVGNGWYRCWGLVKYETGVPTGIIQAIGVGETAGITSCTSPGNIFIWGAQHQLVTIEEEPGAYIRTIGGSHTTGSPRFDYDPITHQALGMLMEESRTNRALSSQHNTNTDWVRTGSHVDADVIDAPDFGITADRMTAMESPATTSQTISQGTSAYTVSVFAMRGTTDWVYLVGESTSAPRAWFNLATGTIGTIDAGLTGATIQNVGGGWYRIAISDVGAAGNENCTLGISDADGSTTVTPGNEIYLWGWQNEAGAFATSYIPCQDSPMRRDADVAVMTGTNFSSWFNDAHGTFVAEFDVFLATDIRTVLSADSGNVLDMVRLGTNGTNPKALLNYSGATQADLDLGTVEENALAKSAISYAPNDVSGCFNGGPVITDTLAIMPVPGTISQLRIGWDGTFNPRLNGHVRRIRFFNVAKSDSQIQVLTSVGGIVGITGALAATEGADIAAADNAITGTMAATEGADIPVGAGGFTFTGTLAATEGADVAAGVGDFLVLDLDFATALDSRITFSRAGLGTYYDSAGVLKYAAHNNFWWSEDFSQTVWSKAAGVTITTNATTAPDGTTTADRYNWTTAGTTANTYMTQGLTPIWADRCIVSIYAKAGSKTFLMIGSTVGTTPFQIWFNLTTGAVGTVGAGAGVISGAIADAGNGWYRCSALMTMAGWGSAAYFHPGEANGNINCTSPGDIYLWGGQAEYVTTATTPSTYLPTTTAAVHGPRIDYDPVTHVAKGLLIEEARTNSGTNTEDFAHANWVKTGITVTANQIASPDGATTADLITTSAGTATIIGPAGAISLAVPYVQGVFAKKGTSDWIYMIGQATDVPKVWFNLNTGTVGTIQAGITSAAIENVGNGWYRCWFADVGGTGLESLAIGVSDADNSATATVGRTVYLWGAQSEGNVPFISSYIPTGTGSNITRGADIAVVTGSNFSSWYNQPAGTFVVDFDVFSALSNRYIMKVDSGVDAESMTFQSSVSGAGLARVSIIDGGVGQASITTGAVSINAPHKLGLSFAVNDFAISLDGATVATDTSGTVPTPTQMRIGSEGILYLNGRIRRIRFYTVAKSDSELQALTT